MTTIAYRDGILAADTQVTHGPSIMVAKCRKVFKLPDGALYGHTGSLEAGDLMRRSLVEGYDPPNLSSDVFDGLLIRPNGQTFFYEKKAWVRLKCDYAALGSGKEHAYGAMTVGASAEQAVQAAMALDPSSGGRVQFVELDNYKKGHSYVEQMWERD